MKRERIFTRLHTVKLRLLSNKAMKISEAVLLMILAVSIVLSAFAVTLLSKPLKHGTIRTSIGMITTAFSLLRRSTANPPTEMIMLI